LFKICPAVPPGGLTQLPLTQVAGLMQSLFVLHVVSHAVPVELQGNGAHLLQSIGMPHWKPPFDDIQLPLGSQLVVSSVPVHDVRHALASELQL